MTPQPLCRRCDKPAAFNDGELLCAAHFAVCNSPIAKGLASSGDDVTGTAAMPPHPVAVPVTDPFESCGGVEGHAAAHLRPYAPSKVDDPIPQITAGALAKPNKSPAVWIGSADLAAGIKPGPQDFPFSGIDRNATAFRSRALNSIEPNARQESSSSVSGP